MHMTIPAYASEKNLQYARAQSSPRDYAYPGSINDIVI